MWPCSEATRRSSRTWTRSGTGRSAGRWRVRNAFAKAFRTRQRPADRPVPDRVQVREERLVASEQGHIDQANGERKDEYGGERMRANLAPKPARRARLRRNA